MRKLNKWVLYISLFFTFSSVLSQDLFDFNHSASYGMYLFDRAEYDLAIPEFERAIFLNSSDTSILEFLIKSYFYLQKYEIVEKKVIDFFSDENVPVAISHIYIKSSIKLNHFDNYNSFYENRYSLNNNDILFYDISTNIYKKEYEIASKKLQNINSDSYALKYLDLLNDKKNTKYKSPGLSMVLSSIIPGAGKIYTGYWKDGLVSFIFIGTSAYQAFRGFDKKGTDSFYGWFFGSISISLYLGNIYGSGKSAHKRNHITEKRFYNQADHILFNY